MNAARRIRVRGVVQGVGFRPFVWRLARELELRGWVRNDSLGVEIAAEGAVSDLRELAMRLGRDAPPRARVDEVVSEIADPAGWRDFLITDSVADGAAVDTAARCATAIGPDTAICADCLAELVDPRDRRWRHPFITCTNCGPRYTIAHGLPYDRARTSMGVFAMCADCAREYRDPADRRFHAEPIACPNCGPHLRLLDGAGTPLAGDPLAVTVERLRAGAIVAVKGLGGYHLVCDARNARAVATLRIRKARDAKPFAVMAANTASLRGIARIDEKARRLLVDAERPIVVVPKERGADRTLEGIADGLDRLGIMLPTTPLQWLLFHEAAGRPAGLAGLDAAQELVLVMTSANPGGEPLVTDDAAALARLGGIADAHLQHDRQIVVRCDDSVQVGDSGRFLRRARGHTPRALRLPAAGPPVLAVGAYLKNTVCVTRGDEAFVSQHIGDLDDAATVAFFEESIHHLCAILEVAPAVIAHDLHPDIASTWFAHSLAAARGIPTLAVQHHHAHVAAVIAEHRIEEPVLGVALDGVGFGTDGGAWGGELLRVDGADWHRVAHLVTLPLPGGDCAAREPWRLAAAALHRLGRGQEIAERFAREPAAARLAQILERGVCCPPTSSAGRVFDAAAALLGVAERSRFEAQAAMRLEALARRGVARDIERLWNYDSQDNLDVLPLLEAIADWHGRVEDGAALFHASFAAALADWIVRSAVDVGCVALCGGCLANGLLRDALGRHLGEAGLRVLHPIALPPNDGAISVGQAWAAIVAAEV